MSPRPKPSLPRRHTSCGNAHSRRNPLVRHPALRSRAACRRCRRRRESFRRVSSPGRSARTLQHGRHAEGAAHRASHPRPCAVHRHGARDRVDHGRHARLARPLGGVGDARLFAHKYGTTSYRRSQRDDPQWPGQPRAGTREIRAVGARPRRERQFLQQARHARRRRARFRRRAFAGRQHARPALRDEHAGGVLDRAASARPAPGLRAEGREADRVPRVSGGRCRAGGRPVPPRVPRTCAASPRSAEEPCRSSKAVSTRAMPFTTPH